MKTYKVWVEIEECDEETDEYTTIESLGVRTYETEKEARALANLIFETAKPIAL
ncbi:hypothetical protein KAR91_60325 [Candidatus Pacearchaeota archaeon]|nr:hypothetical protein [Candidatus Pacearchaeota archaeon]